jgi:hypothetical protein
VERMEKIALADNHAAMQEARGALYVHIPSRSSASGDREQRPSDERLVAEA